MFYSLFFQLSGKIQVFVNIFAFFYIPYMAKDKIHKMTSFLCD